MASGRIEFQHKHRVAVAERIRRRHAEHQRSRSNEDFLVE